MYVLFVCFRAGNVHALHLQFVCTSDLPGGATVVFISKELSFPPVMIGEFTLLPPEAEMLPFYIKKKTSVNSSNCTSDNVSHY